LLLFEQFLLLACAFALAAANGPSTNPNSLAALLVGMFSVTAMAVQNALLHLVRKQAPSTAVMTGNIVVSTLALIDMTLDRGSDRSDAIDKWKATWPLLAGFLAGCIAGATAVSLSHDLAWLLPAVASLILVLCWGSPKNPLDVRGSARRRHRLIEWFNCSNNVQIADKGRELINKVLPQYFDWIKGWIDNLSYRDKQIFLELLTKLQPGILT
jgi:hypothetical protein